MIKKLIEWVNKLATTHTVYVAGGAALDIHLGREPRDVDVFVVSNEPTIYDADTLIINIYGQWCILKTKLEESDNYGDRLIYWTVIDNIQVDIILTPPEIGCVLQLVQGFDFDICEAWVDNIGYDETWSVSLTTKALNAIKTKTIEHREDDSINMDFIKTDLNKEKRIARYKEKFPDYIIWEKL